MHVQCTPLVVQISVRKLKSLNNFPNKVYIFLEEIKFISEKHCRKVVTPINRSDINTRSGGAPPNWMSGEHHVPLHTTFSCTSRSLVDRWSKQKQQASNSMSSKENIKTIGAWKLVMPNFSHSHSYMSWRLDAPFAHSYMSCIKGASIHLNKSGGFAWTNTRRT